MKYLGLLVGMAATCVASATILTVDDRTTRSPDDRQARIDAAARQFGANLRDLTRNERQALKRAGRPVDVLTQPVTINLTGRGPSRTTSRVRGDITLSFTTSGSRSFPTEYRSLLSSVLTSARSTMNLLFGNAFESGNIVVSNYDADLGDRDAVAGGVYLHDNGSGQREIRFPVYQDIGGFKREVASVNFLHTLLLAYQGGKTFPGDGWNEGLVRAATAQIALTPGALPSGLDSNLVAGVVESTYSAAGLDDWVQSPALTGAKFIAPNLALEPLPVGGSIGGLYLLRYQNAASVWRRLFVQYPTFAQVFRRRFFDSGLTGSVSELQNLGQLSINELGGNGSLVEGDSFTGWSRKQPILDTTLVPGLRIASQPFPITDGLGGNDFGVFGLQLHAFEVRADGAEILSRGSAYPIFWSPSFTRFFTSSQDERMDIQQGYGSVAPNFPGSSFNNEPYRVAVDFPFEGRIVRSYLPAGAVATASNPTPNNIFGTLTGVRPVTGTTYEVEVRAGSQVVTLPVRNLAFGGRLTGFPQQAALTLRVRERIGTTVTTVLTRQVNKVNNQLGLTLHVNPITDQTFTLGPGLNVTVAQLEPFRSGTYQSLGLSPSEALFGRWNAFRGRFDLGDEVGFWSPGVAAFSRSTSAVSRNVSGRAATGVVHTVPLRAGWNLITPPVQGDFSFSQIDVLVAANSAQTWTDARGTTLGAEVFEVSQGPNDAFTGLPETANSNIASIFRGGRAYYVRCLEPTGATLAFFSNQDRGITREVQPVPLQGWTLRLRIDGAPREFAITELGQGRTTTDGFDPQFDVEQPPRITSGLEWKSDAGLYRDISRYGPVRRVQYRLSGLVPGRNYNFRAETMGNAPTFEILDQTSRLRKRANGSLSFTFVARSDEHIFQVTTRAAR